MLLNWCNSWIVSLHSVLEISWLTGVKELGIVSCIGNYVQAYFHKNLMLKNNQTKVLVDHVSPLRTKISRAQLNSRLEICTSIQNNTMRNSSKHYSQIHFDIFCLDADLNDYVFDNFMNSFLRGPIYQSAFDFCPCVINQCELILLFT